MHGARPDYFHQAFAKEREKMESMEAQGLTHYEISQGVHAQPEIPGAVARMRESRNAESV